VIVSAIHREPLRNHDDYDASFTLPERLRQAGVRFCISGSARSETWNARNLPWHAATAAAYGLPRDEALKSITLYPAQILGVADRLGSLEPGRDATLFVSTGDPLETEPQVTSAWIQGRRVDLSSRHSQLYRKYQEKYRQLANP
jgi:imidazolonepropionase-like amidohydrolase